MANLLGNIHETIVCIHFLDTTMSLFQIHPTQTLKIICYIDIHFPLKKNEGKYTDAIHCKSGQQKFNELNTSHCSVRFSTKLFHPPKVKTVSFLKNFLGKNLKPDYWVTGWQNYWSS